MSFDRIIVTTVSGCETISNRLTTDFKIPVEKIDISFVNELILKTYEARNSFLKNYAQLINAKGLIGSVAEGGVLDGYFAKRINSEFPDRKLYLFDTFEGFDERDVANEGGLSQAKVGEYKTAVTEPDLIASMQYPENIIIRKGYFPETAIDIHDTFVFVNLDFDLYSPTLAGLNIFYPKLVQGGLILVHDYFYETLFPNVDLAFLGVRKAVDEFCKNYDLLPLPIGDQQSVAIVKQGTYLNIYDEG